MRLNVDKLKSSKVMIGKNGLVMDNTKIPIKEKFQPIPLTQEQQQNFKLHGSLNKPEVKQTYLNQGKKLTPAEQQASNKKLAEQGKLQAYQKQQEIDAKNLEKAAAVAPYVIPGIGQAMWAGKAVDLATSGVSDGKYKSWGNMVSDKTGVNETVADLTNPGYYGGAFPKLLSKGVQSSVKNIYKINPFAEKLIDKNASFRVAGFDSYDDMLKSGVVRSGTSQPVPKTIQEALLQRPTSFPSFQKGYADINYLPKEGGVIYKTKVPTFKRGEVNPVTGEIISGRHYAHRPIDMNTGKVITELPAKDVQVFKGNPHWLKGYQEIPQIKPKNNQYNNLVKNMSLEIKDIFNSKGKEEGVSWLKSWYNNPIIKKNRRITTI